MNRVLSLFRRLATRKMTESLDQFTPVTEGSATILFPKAEDVFYNPVQQFNRDLSTLSIRAWSEIYGENLIKKRKRDEEVPENKPYISILEALSATGLRAVRYAKEIPRVHTVVANDFLEEAVKSIERNAKHNGVESIVRPNRGDANAYMHEAKSSGKLFNVIDLDPYGTASPFIDAAVQSVSNDGMLLVTCTDLAVLAGGGYPEKAFALYGGSPLINHDAAHEAALRLVLGMISNSAAKYKKSIEPLLCLSIDFYVRLFIKVKTAPVEVKEVGSKMSVQYMCSGCGAVQDQQLGKVTVRESNNTKKYGLAQGGSAVGPFCTYCGFVNHVAGPMYNGKLHKKEFIAKILELNKNVSDEMYKTRKRIEGMLTLAQNELEDAQFYFKPERVSSVLKCQVPPLKVLIAGLGNMGYDASLTHAIPSAVKTNAPWGAIWGLLKEYIKQKCPEHDIKKLSETTAGYRILSNDEVKCEKEVSFELNDLSGKVERLRKLKITRYQENPSKNWGPKAKPQ